MRRLVATLAFMLTGALTLQACASGDGGTGEAGDPVEGGDFVSGLYLEPRGLDPHRQTFWETYRVSRHIFEPLVQEDLTETEGTPELLPALAEEWTPSDDGRTWTFTLRQDAAFHDGSQFDAEAVHKNVQRVWDEDYEFFDEESAGRLQVWFDGLESAGPVDDHTYEFTFAEPFLGFPRVLAQAMFTLPIGNPAVWEEHGNDAFAEQPEGTGPYRFVSRAIGDRIELERHEDYYGTRPYLDTLTFRIIPNNQTRVASLISGELDQISYVQPDDVQTLEDSGFQVPEGTGAQLIYLSYNFTNPELQDERVRKALIHGLDRNALAEEVYNGYANPQYSFLPPGNEAYDPSVRDFEYDPAEARRLLAEAGYDDGELQFNLVIDVANENLAQWLQEAYSQIGVETEIVSLDRVSYSDRVYNPQENDGLSLDEFGETNAEWLFNGYNGLSGRGLDQAGFPEVTDAIRNALHTDDSDTRIQEWQDAEQRLRENALVIPAVNLTRYYALGPNVQGFTFAATNWYDLNTVWLSE